RDPFDGEEAPVLGVDYEQGSVAGVEVSRLDVEDCPRPTGTIRCHPSDLHSGSTEDHVNRRPLGSVAETPELHEGRHRKEILARRGSQCGAQTLLTKKGV